jgi:hypothetical protein
LTNKGVCGSPSLFFITKKNYNNKENKNKKLNNKNVTFRVIQCISNFALLNRSIDFISYLAFQSYPVIALNYFEKSGVIIVVATSSKVKPSKPIKSRRNKN